MAALQKAFSHLPGLGRGCSGTGKERKAAFPGAQPGPVPGSRTAAQGRAPRAHACCRVQWGRGVQELIPGKVFLEVQQSSEGKVKK